MGSFACATAEEELAYIEHGKEWIMKNPIENKSFEDHCSYIFDPTRERRWFLANYRLKSILF